VLLAGTSAGLMAHRRPPRQLGAFLLARGLWLVAIEWFVISTAWTFAPLGLAQFQGKILVPLQVIWAIGARMVVLAGAEFLGARACLVIGAAIVPGHNLVDGVWPASHRNEVQPLWVALHAQMRTTVGPYLVVFAYPLLPWIGVMLLGFGVADGFARPPPERNVLLRRTGIALTLAFFALGALNVYGDPRGWSVHPGEPMATVMAFLNTTKYPPSLLFLMMTGGTTADVQRLLSRGLHDRGLGVLQLREHVGGAGAGEPGQRGRLAEQMGLRIECAVGGQLLAAPEHDFRYAIQPELAMVAQRQHLVSRGDRAARQQLHAVHQRNVAWHDCRLQPDAADDGTAGGRRAGGRAVVRERLH
jgi:uncharacterized membrane protein